MGIKTIEIPLGPRSYSIDIGPGILKNGAAIARALRGSRKAVVVSNVTVAPLYADRLCEELVASGVHVVRINLPDGERHKNWNSLQIILDAMMGENCERSTPVIAVGGGVVGDIAGFAASIYQRGAPFVQIPTTLLAQVDSSVGGKTGINHPLGKNMIGSFHQPSAVLIDTDVLKTLPDRELSAGLAEVIKYGLLRDRAFIDWLETAMAKLLRHDQDALLHAIETSCKHKAEIVALDEREGGIRALLNLGHTFGHAIEAGVGFGQWLHGEAVAAGTMIAAEVSRLCGWLSAEDVSRIEKLYRAANLPVFGPPKLQPDRYFELMQHDKKVKDGAIRFILLRGIGNAFQTADVDRKLIEEAILLRTEPGNA